MIKLVHCGSCPKEDEPDYYYNSQYYTADRDQGEIYYYDDSRRKKRSTDICNCKLNTDYKSGTKLTDNIDR